MVPIIHHINTFYAWIAYDFLLKIIESILS
jgi:hypothetical protein